MSEEKGPEMEEEKIPTPEEVKEWYKKQIEMAELRATLAKHHRDTAVYEKERIEASIQLDMMKNPEKYAEPEMEMEKETETPIRNLKKK